MTAKQLLQLRKKLGFTQREMAQKLCTSNTALSAYENGQRTIPRHTAELARLFIMNLRR